MSRPFLKMNGLGNDFVVVESRSAPFAPTAAEVRAITSRDRGVGCDQLISIETSRVADAFMRIWNADGEEVSACGNAARCVGWLVMRAADRVHATLETRAGVIAAAAAGDERVSVDMGRPGLDWRDIPIAEDLDTRGIELAIGPPGAPVLHTPGCVSMGNPHAVFFVDDVERAPVREVGSLVERHPLFPEGVNVGFAEIRDRDRVHLRVWERGAGETRACGTGACAALVAASRRGLCGREADVVLPGGALRVAWRMDDHVVLTGPIALDYAGTLP